MQRAGKTILRVLGVLMVVLLLATGALYWYITHAWQNYYTKAEVEQYAAEINAASAMSPLFYAIYDKLNGNCRHQTIQQVYIPAIAKQMLGIDNYTGRCWVADAAIRFSFNSKQPHRFKPQVLGFGLQQYTTPEKCFDYRIQYEAHDVASYFQVYGIDTTRPFYQLSDTTGILTYIAICDRPAYYRLRREALAERVKKLKARL